MTDGSGPVRLDSAAMWGFRGQLLRRDNRPLQHPRGGSGIGRLGTAAAKETMKSLFLMKGHMSILLSDRKDRHTCDTHSKHFTFTASFNFLSSKTHHRHSEAQQPCWTTGNGNDRLPIVQAYQLCFLHDPPSATPACQTYMLHLSLHGALQGS